MPPDPNGESTPFSRPLDEAERLLWDLIESGDSDGTRETRWLERVEGLRAQHPELAESLLRRVQWIGEVGDLLSPRETSGEKLQGERFGDFEVVRRLGTGGMGAVYAARQVSLGREVALKLIREDRLLVPATRERLRREARAMANLRHVGICGVHDVGEVGGVPYIAMQYVRGETLAAILDRAREAGSLPRWANGQSEPPDASHLGDISHVLQTMEKVARAIHFAHESGVVHRDLKPGNIMIDERGEPVVLDFGLASAESWNSEPVLTASDSPIGTPAYMSPEQVRPKGRRPGRASDVFSLGVVLFEALTLHRPFDGESVVETYDSIERDPMPNPQRHNPELARDVVAVLGKALEKDPARRYSTAAELADELGRLRRAEPVHARQLGVAAKTWRWARRNRVGAGLITALSAMIVVALLWLWHSDRQRAEITERQANFDMLAGVVHLEAVRDAQSELYPPWPQRIGAMRAWLDGPARVLEDMLPELDATLARLRQSAGLAADSPPELVAARILAPADHFLFETLNGLRDKITALRGTEVVSVGRRLSWAERIEQLTRAHPNAAATWEQAANAIAAADGQTASVLYRGAQIDLRPQTGLVPIGPNPKTKLWEFYHLRSALDPADGSDPSELEIPRPDPVTGRYDVTRALGIVFVLLPGGDLWIGAQREDPAKPNYDVEMSSNEGPVQPAHLSPFFIAAHELTEAQRARLAESATRSDSVGDGAVASRDDVTRRLSHPIGEINWFDSRDLLAHYGLQLPTEAQWEYAARAGSTTPYPGGSTVDCLAGYANVLDRVGHAEVPWWGPADDLDDGFAFHAPVGSFEPNAFGLFDMYGNVWEWCLDGGDLSLPIRDGDGARVLDVRAAPPAIRGGSFCNSGLMARSSTRVTFTPMLAIEHAGLRAARALRGR